MKSKALLVVSLIAISMALPRVAESQDTELAELQTRVTRLESLVAALIHRVSELEGSDQSAERPAPVVRREAGWRDRSNWRRLQKGMSMAQVTRLLGEPDQVSTLTYTIIWRFGGGNVTFDARSNRVDGWSEPRGPAPDLDTPTPSGVPALAPSKARVPVNAPVSHEGSVPYLDGMSGASLDDIVVTVISEQDRAWHATPFPGESIPVVDVGLEDTLCATDFVSFKTRVVRIRCKEPERLVDTRLHVLGLLLV